MKVSDIHFNAGRWWDVGQFLWSPQLGRFQVLRARGRLPIAENTDFYTESGAYLIYVPNPRLKTTRAYYPKLSAFELAFYLLDAVPEHKHEHA